MLPRCALLDLLCVIFSKEIWSQGHIVHKVYSDYIYFPSHMIDWRANREWLCAKITLHATFPLYPTNEAKG
jgi:hypothetical protein